MSCNNFVYYLEFSNIIPVSFETPPLHLTSFNNLQLVFPQPGKPYHQLQGKMNIHLTLIAVILISMHEVLAVDVMPELKKNVLNFGYGMQILNMKEC